MAGDTIAVAHFGVGAKENLVTEISFTGHALRQLDQDAPFLISTPTVNASSEIQDILVFIGLGGDAIQIGESVVRGTFLSVQSVNFCFLLNGSFS